MICKKCGREYEDDMPKCLWCDAPRDEDYTPPLTYIDIYGDSPEKLVDPELERNLFRDVKRGRSAIRWTIILIAINIINWIIEIIFGYTAQEGTEAMANRVPVSQATSIAIFTIAISAIVLCITAIISLFKNWFWIYHTQKEQRKFTETFFKPWGAVYCRYIPIANYFLFRNLIQDQTETLNAFGLKTRPFPQKTLNRFLAFFIIGIVVAIWNHFAVDLAPLANFTYHISSIIICIYSIKIIKFIVENEQSLQTMIYNNILKNKVESIIEQKDFLNKEKQ
jgi:hypothetical protein